MDSGSWQPWAEFRARVGQDKAVGVPDRFREAMELRDFGGLVGLFADDVEFFSPRSAEPYRGVRAVGVMLWAAQSTFRNLRYTGQLSGSVLNDRDGAVETHVLRFRARGVRGGELDGVDIIELDHDGLIRVLTVMLRPLESIAAVRQLRVRAPE